MKKKKLHIIERDVKVNKLKFKWIQSQKSFQFLQNLTVASLQRNVLSACDTLASYSSKHRFTPPPGL